MPYNVPMLQPWSQWEEELLTRLWGEGLRVKVIAARIGRSPSAIWRKRKDMGLLPRFEPREAPAPRRVRLQPLPPGARTLPPLASERDELR